MTPNEVYRIRSGTLARVQDFLDARSPVGPSVFADRLPATLLIAFIAGGMMLPGSSVAEPEQRFSAESINQAEYSRSGRLDRPNPMMLKAQILLDRADFSPGLIDAKDGENVRKAIGAFQGSHGLEVSGKLDQSTWDELTRTGQEPAMIEYPIAEEDVRGPFQAHIPHDLVKMARLEHLSYTSPLELLAEKFHVDPKLLKRLNPTKDLARAGTRILVPNVGVRKDRGSVARVEVDKLARALRAFGAAGELVAFYPASIGSEEKPAPSGRYRIRKVLRDPTYHYDPKFHFKGVHTRRKLEIAAGPNNPVGVVWIDLTKPSYGIHGTPEPARIGKTHSHGCIRLTNWDVLDLAGRVHKGIPVDFVDEPSSEPRAESSRSRPN